MASTKVTLTLTPNELQVVVASLRMFAHISKRWGDENALEGYAYPATIVDGRPMSGTMKAQAILQDIGLK